MQLINGDCLTVLKTLDDNSIDSLITDPPAGISFMGKAWDSDKGGRAQWIAWMAEIMEECLRVLKPGAHGLVWALPRTSHWTAMALENAGFEIRDVVVHIFSTGFPKSLSISKAIDKAAGVERKIIEKGKAGKSSIGQETRVLMGSRPTIRDGSDFNITAPATDDAKQWEGWGTALKPANEHWVLIRKPLGEKTVAKNVLKWSTGGINIDKSRISAITEEWEQEKLHCNSCAAAAASQAKLEIQVIPANFVVENADIKVLEKTPGKAPEDIRSEATGCFAETSPEHTNLNSNMSLFGKSTTDLNPPDMLCTISTKTKKTTASKTCNLCFSEIISPITTSTNLSGRFPSNLILSHHADCELLGAKEIKPKGGSPKPERERSTEAVNFKGREHPGFKVDGKETVPDYRCHDECAVAELDRQSGTLKPPGSNNKKKAIEDDASIFGIGTGLHNQSTYYPQSGGASRFFYCAKASRKDKGEGNTHPTPKSTKLMEYLIKLITPPGGIVLDCFMGSGSTGVAAKRADFGFVGIEKDSEYFEIAAKRINP